MAKAITREEVEALIIKLELHKLVHQIKMANIDEEISRCQTHLLDIDNECRG